MVLDGKTIAFLGDSITCGGCLQNVKSSYVNRISEKIRWKEVLCYGVPGSRIGEYIGDDPRKIGAAFTDRFYKMKEGIDIVVIFGGTNDFGIGNAPLSDGIDETPQTFCGALNYVMEGLKKKYTESFILFMTPLHRMDENTVNKFSGAILKDYVDAIKDKARYHGIHILDMYSLKRLQPGPIYYTKYILDDGVHPNEKGHAIIAEELLSYLKKVK